MKTYDDIIDFDYTDESEWRGWIEKKFLSLYKQLTTLLQLRKSLENFLKTDFKKAFSQQFVKEVLLGGVTKEGEYSDNSLAKLYKNALGIFIDPQKWIAYFKGGLDPVENGMTCNFDDTTFLMFINELKELIERILEKTHTKQPTMEEGEVEEIRSSPEKLLEIIREIYWSLVAISVNHDYHMFFILNTRCIPRFFIERAYPKLENNFKDVAEILELEEKFIPNINDEEVRKGYTLIGHKKEGFADILYKIQHHIWDHFNFSKDTLWKGDQLIDLKNMKEVFSLIAIPDDQVEGFKETDLVEKYKEIVSGFFKKEVDISNKIVLIPINKFDCKDCMSEFEQQDMGDGHWYDREVCNIEFILEDSLIKKVEHTLRYRKSWNQEAGQTSRSHDEQISITVLFSNLSSLLFLGIVSIEIEGNRILMKSNFSD